MQFCSLSLLEAFNELNEENTTRVIKISVWCSFDGSMGKPNSDEVPDGVRFAKKRTRKVHDEISKITVTLDPQRIHKVRRELLV